MQKVIVSGLAVRKNNGKILDISTMEYSKCVKCLAGSFEGGWRYAQKW
jgi:hypothetical protein